MKAVIKFLLPVLAMLCFGCGIAAAAVTGDCVNCHTMHNSQDGISVAEDRFGNPLNTAEINLLKMDCLGCHTSATNTIETIGTGNQSKVPIVLTTNEPIYPPTGSSNSVLAGGNFYWVAQSGVESDNKGHNVFGLRGNTFAENVDGTLIEAPGNVLGIGTGSPCNDCHGTLATETSGCKGCHLAAHHADDGLNNVVTEGGDGWYRFLHGAQMYTGPNASTNLRDAQLALPGVMGVEDPNWEQDPASHNIYKGATGLTSAGTGVINGNSIGMYCTGCHSRFHHDLLADGGGMQDTTGAWIRHPSDVVLPSTGEYANYSYTALAPVAYETIDSAGVGSTELVTCISCHRPHGSPYPDMLRWDYETCVTSTTSTDCGCFACHSSKDGIADVP